MVDNDQELMRGQENAETSLLAMVPRWYDCEMMRWR